jgi:hypothetical protein
MRGHFRFPSQVLCRRLPRLLLVLSLALSPTIGQTQASRLPRFEQIGPTVEGQEVLGIITRVDIQAMTITLDNGEEYLIPAAVARDLATLGEGTVVILRYDTQGGRNIARHVQVRL